MRLPLNKLHIFHQLQINSFVNLKNNAFIKLPMHNFKICGQSHKYNCYQSTILSVAIMDHCSRKHIVSKIYTCLVKYLNKPYIYTLNVKNVHISVNTLLYWPFTYQELSKSTCLVKSHISFTLHINVYQPCQVSNVIPTSGIRSLTVQWSLQGRHNVIASSNLFKYNVQLTQIVMLKI